LVPEADWVDIVYATGLGNEGSFFALFDRTNPLVFTLIFQMIQDRQLAEALTVEAFLDIWTRASTYKPEHGTVVAWIMNQARQRAAHRLRGSGGSIRPKGVQTTVPDLAAMSRATWSSLSKRIETQGRPILSRVSNGLADAQWREVAPGITCKILSTDEKEQRVSMLVRLAPGGEYPPHTHAGTEELHLLECDLWIDAKKLYPGDYNRASVGTADARVWSETGCMCVLITSTRDRLA
jgi:DNA-directed RNA polymerase specialized sigma24 family protein